MTLKQIIKSEGRNMTWVATKLNITRNSLTNKIKSGRFSDPEKYHLARVLNQELTTIENAI